MRARACFLLAVAWGPLPLAASVVPKPPADDYATMVDREGHDLPGVFTVSNSFLNEVGYGDQEPERISDSEFWFCLRSSTDRGASIEGDASCDGSFWRKVKLTKQAARRDGHPGFEYLSKPAIAYHDTLDRDEVAFDEKKFGAILIPTNEFGHGADKNLWHRIVRLSRQLGHALFGARA